MDHQRFDALTRGLASQGTRRSLLRGLSGVAAGGLAALGLGSAAALARTLKAADTEEQAVLLYEHIALIASTHSGPAQN